METTPEIKLIIKYFRGRVPIFHGNLKNEEEKEIGVTLKDVDVFKWTKPLYEERERKMDIVHIWDII